MLDLREFAGAEAEIGWYFSSGESILGGQSSMGPMLDHAALYFIPRSERVAPELVTAWYSKHRQTSNEHVPDDTALRRFGQVSRRLRDACARWPLAGEILQAYFGEQGDRFAAIPKMSRMCAVIRFTDTGRKLIDKQRKKERGAQLQITAAQRAENAVAATANNVLLGQANTEAHGLLIRALETYTGRTAWASAAE